MNCRRLPAIAMFILGGHHESHQERQQRAPGLPSSIKRRSAVRTHGRFQDFFAPLAQGGPRAGEGAATPRLDVVETGKTYEIQAELPGVNKEDKEDKT